MLKSPINLDNGTSKEPIFDKMVLKFFADILYIKGILYYDELEAILDAKTLSDLDDIFERMMRGGFSPYKRGEYYDEYKRERDN